MKKIKFNLGLSVAIILVSFVLSIVASYQTQTIRMLVFFPVLILSASVLLSFLVNFKYKKVSKVITVANYSSFAGDMLLLVGIIISLLMMIFVHERSWWSGGPFVPYFAQIAIVAILLYLLSSIISSILYVIALIKKQ